MVFARSRLAAPASLALALALGACASMPDKTKTEPLEPPLPVRAEPSFESITLFDAVREREIPVALYEPVRRAGEALPPLVVFSHGNASRNTYYSFINEALAERGYLVASIQQQLPDDPPLAMSGNIFQQRMNSWILGEDNIDYVVEDLRARGLVEPNGKLVLIGHSHGGDISFFYASHFPSRVRAAISLDNLRVPAPHTANPKICTIRAADPLADPGVVPDQEEQNEYDISVVQVPGIKHGDMQDWAPEAQKQEMLSAILACLGETPAVG